MNQYSPLTKARAAKMKLVYFLKRGNEDEKEVSLDEYMEAAQSNNKALGCSPDHVPMLFMGYRVTGHCVVQDGEVEEALV